MLINYGCGIPDIVGTIGRVQEDRDFYGGTLPDRVVLAWSGYFVALVELNLVTEEGYRQLCACLPKIADDPTDRIFTKKPLDFLS